MSPIPQQWAYDPLTDNLYCRVECSDDDVISMTDKADEVAVRRYEDVARRYLSGYAPLLITSTLRGPFDRASGFVNPWAKPIKSSQSTQQSTVHPLRKAPPPTPCESASSQRLEATQATESSYLPSPESLNPDTHPFLERDDIVRVERWRSKVRQSDPIRDEFWTSTSQSKSQSSKRSRVDSSWLKRRPDKRRRTLEPEAKLSSPVSTGNGEAQHRASSPLSSLTSLNGESTPAQPSSQPRTAVRVRPDESTVADASHNATYSSSQRQSRRASQGSRLPPGSEAKTHPEESMVEDSHNAALSSFQRRSSRASQGSRLPLGLEASRRGASCGVSSRKVHRDSFHSAMLPPSSSKPAVSDASRRRSTSIRRSSPAAKPENIHTSSDDSTSISSSDELENEREPVEVDDGPAMHVESDRDVEEQNIAQESRPEADRPAMHVESDRDIEEQDIAQKSTPKDDGVLQVTDPNVTPKETQSGPNPLEVALLSASKLDHHGAWGKHVDRDVNWRIRFRKGREHQHIVPTPPADRPPSRNALDVGDSQDKHQRNETAVDHCAGEGESTLPAPAPVVAELPTSSSASASSAADYASTTLVEGGENDAAEDVQAPREDPTPTKPAPLDPYAIYTSSPSKTDTTASQDEIQPQEDEPPSTPQPNRHTENGQPNALPDTDVAPSGTQQPRVTVEEQSPWMKNSVRVLVNDESEVQSPWMKSALRSPGNNRSGKQSPWMKTSLNYLLNHGPEKQSPSHITLSNQPTQSSVVPPEAQSPWMNRSATQPNVVDDTFPSPYASPQLPQHSEETQEEPRATEAAERSTLSDDVSNADFSIRSFSSFMMSPKLKPRPTPRLSDSYLPRIPSLLAAATENPWETASKPKKRVSWAPLPLEASSPAPTSSFNRASPPPAEPIPDDVEEDSGVFGSHFVAVKRRTDPVRQRLLPPPSQLSQRSPKTDAMAMAFVTAESSNGSSPMKTLGTSEEERNEAEDAATGEGDEEDGEGPEEPVDDVDDVLANLNDFLTTWDVETDLQRARVESRLSHGESNAGFRGIVDMEVGGW